MVFEKFNPLLHARNSDAADDDEAPQFLTIDVSRLFSHFWMFKSQTVTDFGYPRLGFSWFLIGEPELILHVIPRNANRARNLVGLVDFHASHWLPYIVLYCISMFPLITVREEVHPLLQESCETSSHGRSTWFNVSLCKSSVFKVSQTINQSIVVQDISLFILENNVTSSVLESTFDVLFPWCCIS